MEQYLAGIHEEIPLGLPGAKRTASEPYSLTVGDRSYVGLRSRHTIPLPAPTEEQAVVSDTILLRVDRDGRSWFIKIRATFERSAADQVYEGTTAWLQSILAV